MMYIKLFEKWGIDNNLEDLTDKYLSEIEKNPKKNNFKFVFYHENGNIFFEVKIIKFDDPQQEGRLSYDTNSETGQTSNYIIYLRDREDKATLLHELKHFDRMIRTGREKGIIKTGLRWTEYLTDNYGNLKSMFYLLEDDEFEAKYHGYYVNIDKYLKENLIENPTREDVINQINFYLKLPKTDKSYSWWKNDHYIVFSKNSDKKSIDKLFGLLINGEEEITPMIIPSTNIREMYLSVKNYIKKKLGIKSKLEQEQIDKLIIHIEKLMNKNKEKYKRKFDRLYTIMIDKYVN